MWNGEPEAITRLIKGHSNGLPKVLEQIDGIDDKKFENIMTQINNQLEVQFVDPAMPIKDAIDLASFLVKTTVNFSKFSPGASTVGGPVDIAAITKHEGFKWITRKYYYHSELNPA